MNYVISKIKVQTRLSEEELNELCNDNDGQVNDEPELDTEEFNHLLILPIK